MFRLRPLTSAVLGTCLLQLTPATQCADSAAARDGPPVPLPADTHCPLCAGDLGVPIVALTSAEIDSVARVSAETNQSQISRLDSLLAAGAFGSPNNRSARQAAHLMVRLTTLNAYRYLFRYASDSSRVYESCESMLIDVFKRYSDPGLFCIARLKSARMGLGRVCMRYDLSQELEGETVMGGKHMRFRVKDTELDGRRRRVLSLDLPTGSAAIVEVLLADHYTCAVEYQHSEGPPAPYELFLVRDIDGGWLRKWGTHRPTAFMFWVTPQDPGSPLSQLPAGPLVGVRIYIPNLRLQIPVLPDIDFDDLRTIELPQPILDMPYLREELYPGWLEGGEWLNFLDWEGSGPVPPGIRRRFPH